MQEKITVKAKTKDNGAICSTTNIWFNCKKLTDVVANINKGDEVVVEFDKRGEARYASKIVKPGESVEEKSSGAVCEVCGKALKDSKYKKCYDCNKKGAEKQAEPKKEVVTEEKKVYTPKQTSYGSPEDIAGKEIGCALGAASTIASGTGMLDVDEVSQFTIEVAERLLEWMRSKK